MLEKIVQIKNIGRFRAYSAKGDVSFKKLTLVYAENSHGKTTLCAIFRSLQSDHAEFITERKTLGTADAPSVHIRLNNADYHFSNSRWAKTYPDILIFDSVFINENVYAGDYVEHEHKKNLYQAIVGAEGVQLAKKIEDLDKQIRDVNIDLRTKKEALVEYVPTGFSLEDYLGWQPVADIEEQIQQKTEKLDSCQRVVMRTDEIRAKGLFVKIQLPFLPSDFPAVLAKQMADIAADAESKVRQQIAQHQMGRQGESWLSQGLAYLKDNRCPFCGQGVQVQVNELITAYRSHFSTAYRDLKQEVTHLAKRVNDAIGETSLDPVQQAITTNIALVEFWRQFIKVDLPAISFPDIQQKYTALREKCLTLAKVKQDSPTEAITPDADFASVLAEVEDLRVSAAEYNRAVDTVNTRVNEQKEAVRSQADIAALKKKLEELKVRKKRFEPEVAKRCQAYQDSVARKRKLEEAKNTTRQQLDRHCQDLLKTYEQSINEYLDQFNAGFRITNTRHLYTGGTPSSHYQIEINGTALDLGDSNTPAGIPCFRTSLSSGDRSALALAFFLAILKQDMDIGRKIVVFDDPFTSMDCFRRTWTEQSIRRVLQFAQQVIVFSHEAGFLKGIRMGMSDGEVKTLQMRPAAQDNMVISEWDMEAATQSTYEHNYRTLCAYRDENNGNLPDVAKAIRPFLEDFYRFRFPNIFQPADNLGDFINKARQAASSSTISLSQSELDELEAINQYARSFHHGQSPSISPDELLGFVKRTLKLHRGS